MEDFVQSAGRLNKFCKTYDGCHFFSHHRVSIPDSVYNNDMHPSVEKYLPICMGLNRLEFRTTYGAPFSEYISLFPKLSELDISTKHLGEDVKELILPKSIKKLVLRGSDKPIIKSETLEEIEIRMEDDTYYLNNDHLPSLNSVSLWLEKESHIILPKKHNIRDLEFVGSLPFKPVSDEIIDFPSVTTSSCDKNIPVEKINVRITQHVFIEQFEKIYECFYFNRNMERVTSLSISDNVGYVDFDKYFSSIKFFSPKDLFKFTGDIDELFIGSWYPYPSVFRKFQSGYQYALTSNAKKLSFSLAYPNEDDEDKFSSAFRKDYEEFCLQIPRRFIVNIGYHSDRDIIFENYVPDIIGTDPCSAVVKHIYKKNPMKTVIYETEFNKLILEGEVPVIEFIGEDAANVKTIEKNQYQIDRD